MSTSNTGDVNLDTTTSNNQIEDINDEQLGEGNQAPQTRQRTGKNKSSILPTFKKNEKKSNEAPPKGLLLIEDEEGFRTGEGKESGKKNDDINLGSEIQNSNDKADTSMSSDFTSQGLLVKNNVPSKPIWYEKMKAAVLEGNSHLAKEIFEKVEATESQVIPQITVNSYKKAVFIEGSNNDSELMPLTEYWMKHMYGLDAHIPLTIFTENWINRDHAACGRNSSSKKGSGSNGLTPKDEWWLGSYKWIKCGDLFIRYLTELYDQGAFAKALRKHFDYVKEIDSQFCWVTAMRYDMAVRKVCLGQHISGSPGDPSAPRPKLLEIAKNKTESMKDGYVEQHGNPYMKGGKLERYSPWTGLEYPKNKDHDSGEFDIEKDDEEDDHVKKSLKRANFFEDKRGRGSFRGNKFNSFKNKRSRSPYQKSEEKNESQASTSAWVDKGKKVEKSANKEKE